MALVIIACAGVQMQHAMFLLMLALQAAGHNHTQPTARLSLLNGSRAQVEGTFEAGHHMRSMALENFSLHIHTQCLTVQRQDWESQWGVHAREAHTGRPLLTVATMDLIDEVVVGSFMPQIRIGKRCRVVTRSCIALLLLPIHYHVQLQFIIFVSVDSLHNTDDATFRAAI
jgi:hypothetical protein